jgi:hypothetical protein
MPSALIVVPTILFVLFFVRVNQVLVRLWARNQSSGAARRLSEVSDHRRGLRSRFVVRLMSDRESASDVSAPRMGSDDPACAPKSDVECSEACV